MFHDDQKIGDVVFHAADGWVKKKSLSGASSVFMIIFLLGQRKVAMDSQQSFHPGTYHTDG